MLPSIRSREALMCWERRRERGERRGGEEICLNPNQQEVLWCHVWTFHHHYRDVNAPTPQTEVKGLRVVSNLLPLPEPSPLGASIPSGRPLCIWGRVWRRCSPPGAPGGCPLCWTTAPSSHQERSAAGIHPLEEKKKSCLFFTTLWNIFKFTPMTQTGEDVDWS